MSLAALMKFAEQQMELHPHKVAWRYGAMMFGYSADEMPEPVGVIIGEAPGRSANPYLPLFPHPEESIGARLLGWSNLRYEEYMGKLVRANLYEFEKTSDDEADERARILLSGAADRRFRVLLLGRLVRDVFGCTRDFGRARLAAEAKMVEVGWIPDPHRVNRRYWDEDVQRMVGRYVRWVAGGEEP